MFDIDRWTEIWVTITRNKTRSLMTCFGVFWGILRASTDSRRIRYSSTPIAPANPTKDSTRGETGT